MFGARHRQAETVSSFVQHMQGFVSARGTKGQPPYQSDSHRSRMLNQTNDMAVRQSLLQDLFWILHYDS